MYKVKETSLFAEEDRTSTKGNSHVKVWFYSYGFDNQH